jgi:hypothetical protein
LTKGAKASSANPGLLGAEKETNHSDLVLILRKFWVKKEGWGTPNKVFLGS